MIQGCCRFLGGVPAARRQNEDGVVSWVALQQAGRTAEDVTRKLDQGDLDGAERVLHEAIDRLQKYRSGTGAADAVRLLTELIQRLTERQEMHLFRKSSRYISSHLGRMSSKELWLSKNVAPKFKSGKIPPPPPTAPAAPGRIPEDLVTALKAAQSVMALTGAGISAESGIPTFRDALTGFWSSYDPQTLATPEGFLKDPALVTRWYDERRQQCIRVEPNPGHRALAQLQQWMQKRNRAWTLVTQTVDRLHQAAGSSDVVELHGSLWVWRCAQCGREQEERGGPFPDYPPRCKCGGNRRPAVVWFGEPLPDQAMQRACAAAGSCEVFLSIGTSSQVYPAAGLAELAAAQGARLVEINPEPTALAPHAAWVLAGKAGEVLPDLVQRVIAG